MRFMSCVVAVALLAGCGGGGGATSGNSALLAGTASTDVLPPPAHTKAPKSTPTPKATATPTATSDDTPYTCPTAQTSSGALNCTDLPLGDQKFSTTAAKAGYIYSCENLTGTAVVTSAPWINSTAHTWNMPEKVAVSGNVAWSGTFAQSTSGSNRAISGNELPESPHTTGTFPIQKTDPAYTYDKNPNSIEAHAFSVAIPAEPSQASKPSCLGMGAIGITVTGVAIYNGFDAAGYDAVAREEQDACHGHPDESDTYHYHGDLQACVPDSGSATQNSSLLGYALDGFGIYGPWYNGKILTTADLDECHGITSPVEWNGELVTMYHYVSTYDFPYTLGCYRGTPVKQL